MTLPTHHPSPGAEPAEPTRLLLVDDNPTNLHVLYEALEAEGCELLIALNGEEALSIAEEASPALILLDVNMPGMDGFETCARLKENPATEDIVVIFLSARDSLEDKLDGLRRGAVDYISKPFQFEEVVARVHTQLALVRARHELELLNRQNERLLLNVLPASIAERLREDDRHAVIESFADATICFVDIVGFTQLCSDSPAKDVVGFLNRIFKRLDELSIRHGLEKIKTIGDAYMVAGGVPDRRPDHTAAVCEFALEFLSLLPEIREAEGYPLDVRIGVHSGPVVAGVIGESKFAYDLWGDTVNVASRMEQTGVLNRIHVTESLISSAGDDYEFELRGEIDVRGKGPVRTGFLTGRANPSVVETPRGPEIRR